MNDVTEAFAPEWMTSVDITRVNPGGTYVDGKYISPGSTTVPISAVVQNATADDLQILPEGMRTEETLKLHTISLLQGVVEENQSTADTFTYNGKPWLVYAVFDRKIGAYFKALAIRNNA